jgi:hypothetical protein
MLIILIYKSTFNKREIERLVIDIINSINDLVK